MQPDRGAATGDFRPYEPADWPPVEVKLGDGRWVPGDLRSWSRSPSGWWGSVTYRDTDGNHLDTFPADAIRPDGNDHTVTPVRRTTDR